MAVSITILKSLGQNLAKTKQQNLVELCSCLATNFSYFLEILILLRVNSSVMKQERMEEQFTLTQFLSHKMVSSLLITSSGYGNDIASFPLDLKLLAQPQKVFSRITLEDPFQIAIVDFHGQIVNIDDSSFIKIVSKQQYATISGISLSQANKGLISLKAFQVKAVPKSIVTLSFQQDFISIQDYLKITGKHYQELSTTFYMQQCEIGDILKDNKCANCTRGTYQLETGQSKCNLCPDNFYCAGGNNLEVKKGYWRTEINKTKAFACLLPEACLGGNLSSCKKGYEGLLCGICSGEEKETGDYFARAGKYRCEKCAPNSTKVGQLVGVLMLLLVYVASLVSLIILASSRKQQKQVLMRVMTNYFQIILDSQNSRNRVAREN